MPLHLHSWYKANLLVVSYFILANMLVAYHWRSYWRINQRVDTIETARRRILESNSHDATRCIIPLPDSLLFKEARNDRRGIGHLTLRLYGRGGFSQQLGGRHCAQDSTLGVVINSAPTHWDWRNLVRDTWGRELRRDNITYVFLMGTANASVTQALHDEYRQHGDIVVANVIDVYRNLTLKTIAMLEWLSANCTGVHMVLKVDDDVLLNVPNLLKFVNKQRNATNSIFGRRVQHWKPHRNTTSKYFISVEEYQQVEYPEYTTGPAYLFTRDIVRTSFEAALFTNFMFLEDVFFTGIVAEKLGITRQYEPGFHNRITSDPCQMRSLISIHNMTISELSNAYIQIHNSSLACSTHKQGIT